jgi:hypothetical protein
MTVGAEWTLSMRTESTTTRSSTAGPWDGLPPADSRTATLSGLTTLAILGVAFGALALGIPYFWVVFPVGFGGVLPLVLAYSRREQSTGTPEAAPAAATTADGRRTTDSTRDEALRTLRTRYARGELTDEAFEHRLERLLETETVAEATAWARERSESDSRAMEPDGE